MDTYEIIKAKDPNRGWYIRIKDGTPLVLFIWKDLTLHGHTGFVDGDYGYGEAPGYYHSCEEAKQYLDAYLHIENLRKNVLININVCCGWWIYIDKHYLWKNWELKGFTGHESYHGYGEAPGYYRSKHEAETLFKLYVESEKEKELNRIRGTKMSNNYVVIDDKTITLSDETVRNLKRELGIKRELKFGDIVTCIHGQRVVLFNINGDLIVVNKKGNKAGNVRDTSYYRPTGKNIFKDNLLNLAF